jgi:hypothetical protein
MIIRLLQDDHIFTKCSKSDPIEIVLLLLQDDHSVGHYKTIIRLLQDHHTVTNNVSNSNIIRLGSSKI